MPPISWLVLAVLAGAGAYWLAAPAWRSYRARDARDTNTERYLAWRGRAPRGGASIREGMTGEERRRVWLGAVLGAAAVAALVLFFATS